MVNDPSRQARTRGETQASGRRSRTQARGDASRNQIMDAASKLVLAHGYKGMTVAALCRETGLAPTSIYWHFGSKEGVLLAAMQRSAERFSAEASTRENLGDAPCERLAALLQAAGRSLQKRPEFVRMLMRLVLQREGLDSVSPSLLEMRTIGRSSMVGTLRIAYESLGPELADEIAQSVADTAIAMFDGAFIALQIGPTTDGDRVFAQMAQALNRLIERQLPDRPPPSA
jgi:AcrR family transcriptional regulator